MLKNIFYVILLLSSVNIPTLAMFLALNDGTLILGEIVEQDESKIVFRRWDNDGILEIPWALIHNQQKTELQQKVGLIAPSENNITISGVNIYFKNGGNMLGKIIERKAQVIILKNKSGNIPIPLNNIMKEEPCEIPLLEAFKPLEVYNEIYKRFDLSKAEGNWELAQILTSIGDSAKAKQLLEKTQSLDEGYRAKVETLLQKISKTEQENQQQKSLQKYFMYRNSKRFTEAIQVLESLKDSLEEQTWQQYYDEVLQQQKDFMLENVSLRWAKKAGQKISSIAMDSKRNLAEVQDYLKKTINTEIIKELSEELKISEENVQNYWENRKQSNEYRFSYRDGTFIVGMQGQNTSGQIQGRGYSNTILRNSRLATPQEWWQSSSSTNRKEWLSAYYFEHNFDLIRQELKTCPNCSGQGTQYVGGKIVVCSYCHGLKNERIIVVK